MFLLCTNLLILINCNSKITVHKIPFFPPLGSLIIIWEIWRMKRKMLTPQVFISIKRNKFKYLTLYTVCVDYSGLDTHLESLFTFLQILFSCKAHQFLSSFSYLTTASNGIGSITNSYKIHIIHIDMLASPVWMYFKMGIARHAGINILFMCICKDCMGSPYL